MDYFTYKKKFTARSKRARPHLVVHSPRPPFRCRAPFQQPLAQEAHDYQFPVINLQASIHGSPETPPLSRRDNVNVRKPCGGSPDARGNNPKDNFIDCHDGDGRCQTTPFQELTIRTSGEEPRSRCPKLPKTRVDRLDG